MQRKKPVGAKDWFSLFADGSPAPALLISRGSVLHANEAANALYAGKDAPQDLAGTRLRGFLETSVAEQLELLGSPPANDQTRLLEMPGRILTPKGEVLAKLHAWTSNLDGENLIVLRALPDSCADKQETLHRTDREYRFLSATISMMLNADEEQELLQQFCEFCVSQAGYKLAWVGMANDDHERSISPVAFAGIDPGYVADLRLSWSADSPMGRGPSGTAVRTGEPCLMRDLLHNPLYAPWREAAQKRGFSSAVSFPLEFGNSRGVLKLCSGGLAAFDRQEMLLLEQVAQVLSYGILSLRRDADRLDPGERLRSAKEFVTAFLDNSPLSFCVTQPDGQILMTNPRWRDLLGVQDIIKPGARLNEVLRADSGAFFDEVVRQALDASNSVSKVHRLKLPVGQRHVRATSFPLRDKDGRISGVGSILEDVTERFRSMRAARAGQARLENAERIAGLGHYEFDLTTGRAIWSRNMYRVYGQDPSNPDASTIDYVTNRIVHPADKARFLAHLEEAGRRAGRYETEYRICWPDGQVRYIYARRETLANEQGEVTRMTGTVQDLTDLREEQVRLAESRDELELANENLQQANAELELTVKQLQESEHRYEHLVEHSPDGIAVAHQGRIIFCNSALANITGYDTPEELFGRPLAGILHGDDRPEFMASLVRLTSLGEITPHIELRGKRKDGQITELSIRLAMVERDGGAAIQATIRDVSQWRKLERQVQQMQKMEAIGMLAGGIAHDFNNILFAVLGYADLLADQIDASGEAAEDLRELRAAGLRGRDLVSQLLVFSRQTESLRKAIQLGPVVKEALRFMRATLPATISITPIIPETDDTVLGDTTEMHQVLVNLCTNAWQAMPDGGELEVALQSLEVDEDFAAAHEGVLPGPTLLLRVSDTGIGMSEETIARIFDPFFTTKAVGEGTGLGLSTVYGIVKGMGGTVHVYSEEGKGTSFHIYLPRFTESVSDVQPVQLEQSVPGGDEKILVVDDDERLMRMESRILSRLGYQVTGFSNAQEALEYFRANPDEVQLIFTDHTMPGLTGIQLARTALRLRPQIPVVLATGFAHHSLFEEALVAGVFRVVAKPLVAGALAEAVRGALDDAARRSA